MNTNMKYEGVMVERRSHDGSRKIIAFLVLIILVLAAFMIYYFVIRPSFTGYVVDRQFEAQQILVSAMIQQIQQQGYARITDAEGNSVLLVPAQVQPEESSGTEQTSPQENAFTQ